MQLIRCEYRTEHDRPIIYLFCREDGKRVVRKIDDFVPYFYALKSEEHKAPNLRKDPKTYRGLHGEELTKFYVTLPKDVPPWREEFTKTWESDVLFPIRFMVDKVDSLDSVTPKTMYLDIEINNSSGRVPKSSMPNEEIVCITCCCSGVYTTFVWRHDLSPGIEHREFSECLSEIRYFRTEESMLEDFLGYINSEEPDIVTGWNTSRFDLPYQVSRMKKLGIDYNKISPIGSVYTKEEFGQETVVIKGISTIDLYNLYRAMTVQKQGQEESYKLDFIGKKVLGIGKTETNPNIRWLWKHDLNKLIEYNRMDTFLTVGIDQKMALIEFQEELRRLCFCNIEDCFGATRMMDSYILRMFHDKVVFPSKTRHEKHSYEGGYVESWANGVYENVVVFDIRSLYPAVLWSFNMSPETISDIELPGAIKVDKAYIRQSPKGVLPQTVEELFKERAKYKKLMRQETPYSSQYKIYDGRQYALKTLLNALYGQTAFPGSRIYSPQIAETITWVGRSIIHWSKDFLEGLGLGVIYCDTDSTHFPLNDEIDIDYINGIRDLLNDSYNDFARNLGIETHIFEIELEKIYRKAFYGKSKKRYAGVVCYKDGEWLDKLESWGLETKRSDASQLTRNLMEKVLDMVLRQGKGKDEVLRYIGDEIDRIRKGKYSFSEIGLPKGISKELHEYGGKFTLDDQGKIKTRSGVPVNIRGALYATKELGYELSSKPKMLYILQLPKGLPAWQDVSGVRKKVDSICFDEDSQVPPGTVVNVELMLEKTVKDKLEPIFEAIGWRMSWLNPFWRGKAPKQGTQESLVNFVMPEETPKTDNFLPFSPKNA